MGNRLRIKQFRYGSDNLGYLIFGERSAMAVDGGAVATILEFVAARNLALTYVAHTHLHGDHTVGAEALIDKSGAVRLTPETLLKAKQVMLEATPVRIYHTPGHTEDSLVFHANGYLVTGDTLFNGTVGNCFSGDLRAFYHSISHLLSFPDDTVVYAGHDYVQASMQFARSLESENGAIGPYLKKYDPNHVFSTLADEKKVNPYVRFNSPEITALLKNRGLPTETAYQRWESLMSIE